MALNKRNRLKEQSDFQDVFRKGKAVTANFLFIKAKSNRLPATRFGFIVPSKIIKTAVERNKIRRVLSENIRVNLLLIQHGYDVVIGLRRNGPVASLKDELLGLLKKAGLVQ